MNLSADFTEVLLEYYHLILRWTPKLLVALVTLVLVWVIAGYLTRLISKRLQVKMDDPLLARFLTRIIKWTGRLVAITIALRIMGMGDVAGGLVAGAGVSAFIIGFAFKDIGENFLAGILLAFNRPFKVGHTIETGSVVGNVVGLDLRTTQVKTFDGKDVFIPNSTLIKNPLINFTIDGYLRQDFSIGIDYDTNVDEAVKIVLSTLSAIPGILTDSKQPSVAITSLDQSSLGLTAYYWLDTFDKNTSGLAIKTQAVHQSLKALGDAGIYTPGDVLELKNYRTSDLNIVSAR